jgi:glycosyltransferase involved in cell wall biosynthesis
MSQTLPIAAGASAPPQLPVPPLDVATLATPVEPDLDAFVVEIVIPVYNEEADLEASVRRLRTYLNDHFPFLSLVTIADNASTDRTLAIARELADSLAGVQVLHLDEKGKGRAVRAAWMASRAQVVAYMDVDLSTDLDALLPLVAPLLSGHSHVAIGTRLASGSRVLRSAKRELISRSYNLLLRGVLHNRFSDAQCGFKAIRRETAQRLLPQVDDDHWFFDTELLVLAEQNDLRIHEVPVDWVDDPDSRVNIGGAIRDDLRGVWRLARRRHAVGRAGAANRLHAARGDEPRRHHHASDLTRYAGVGVLSTIMYVALYLALRGHLGMYGANVLASALATVANTYAHARFTFRRQGDMQLRVAGMAGLAAFVLGVSLTTASLSVSGAVGWTSPLAETLAIVSGSLAASAIRFIILQEWSFRSHARRVATSLP